MPGLRLAVVAVTALAFSAFSIKALPVPFVWVGITWACAFVVAALLLPRPWSRYRAWFFLFFNAAAVALLFTAGEVYLLLNERPPVRYSDQYFLEDGVLGTVPVKGHQVRASRSHHGRQLYDVTYTIDADGLRVAPPVNAATTGCILFFGDSFTFGEGLEDTQTLPYEVGIQSRGRYQTYNFGFHGYGPHQMLAEIEHGLVSHAVKCRPDVAIYGALADHAFRAAGKVAYGLHGPRYQLTSDGGVRATGRFDDDQPPAASRLARIRSHLRKSALFRLLADRVQPVTPQETDLVFAIVKRSKDLLSAIYPGIRFHVILWRVMPEEQAVYEEMERGFAKLNLPIHRVEDILPGYTLGAKSLPYVIDAEELHPNAHANRVLADYVLTHIAEHSDRP
jgi:hypothetical protein